MEGPCCLIFFLSLQGCYKFISKVLGWSRSGGSYKIRRGLYTFKDLRRFLDLA